MFNVNRCFIAIIAKTDAMFTMAFPPDSYHLLSYTNRVLMTSRGRNEAPA